MNNLPPNLARLDALALHYKRAAQFWEQQAIALQHSLCEAQEQLKVLSQQSPDAPGTESAPEPETGPLPDGYAFESTEE